MMRLTGALELGVFLIYLGRVDATVSVTSPTESFRGSDGDAELKIFVNVTSDTGWGNVTVTVDTPGGSVAVALTDDSGDTSPWREYYYVITSLFVGDAGAYTFTVQLDDGTSQFDDTSVNVYIYTVAVANTETKYYAVERTDDLALSTYVRTDESWDNVDVTLTAPNGQVIPTTNQASGPIWRFYTGIATDVVAAGNYTFTIQENLAGASKSIQVISTVEVNPTTDVDEYLYRIQSQSSSLIALVPDFYQYLYDGPDSTYILDGGNDMYDRGNYLSVSTSEAETIMASYGKPYEFQSYQFSSVPTYPFTSLMWISNEDGIQDRYEYQVTSQTGILGGQSSQSDSQTFDVNSYRVTYATSQSYDTSTDPSICEVYFFLSNPNWSSVDPDNVTFVVGASPPTSLENRFAVWGPAQNILMGYTLLSRSGGQVVEDSDIRAVLTQLVTIVSEKDEVTISSDDDAVVEYGDSSIVLSSRISVPDWSSSNVTLLTPTKGEVTLADFTEDGDARIYSYTLYNPTANDAGVYTFRVTDGYGFQLDSQTEVAVYVATLEADETEYFGAKGDDFLTLSVRVTAKDWTGVSVRVALPNGAIKEAETTDSTDGERTYTYTVTNLFIEDAGDYRFYTFANGFVTSELENVTVYLYTIDNYPDSFHSHIVEMQDKAVIMTYGLCDGDWANVEAQVKSPTGQIIPMESSEGSTPRIRIFVANVTGPEEGDYEISMTETLQSKSYTKTLIHHMEYHNATVVDDYLHRILTDSDQLVSYVSDWYTYLYDGSDYTNIAGGGQDMYNGGNVISLEWGTLLSEDGLPNQPYGKPYDNGIVTYSSRSLYPFVSLMWISNPDLIPQERFSLKVRGTPGEFTTDYQTNRRILVEGTYTVTYETFQVLRSRGPTICEVYFMIANPDYWNSVAPTSFNLTVGNSPPQFLDNTATVYGSPENIMMGYTLLSSSTGDEISYLEVDLVLENFVSRIAEKDQFSIKPVDEDGFVTAVAGGDKTVEILVETSGQWEGVKVRVVTPSGAEEELTTYRYTNLNIRRIYEYTLTGVSFADDEGSYESIATDSFNYEIKSTFMLHVFTATISANPTDYVSAPGGEVTMSVDVTREAGSLWVEVDTPTRGTFPATCAENPNNPLSQTCQYIVSDIDFQRDDGQYVFRATERVDGSYDYNVTDFTTLQVFSVMIEPTDTVYTVQEGAEILEISAVVSALSPAYSVSVSVKTPGGESIEVLGYNIVDGNRVYEYVIRGVTLDDAGEYLFSATQTIMGETYTVEAAGIGVIVKANEGGELSGGEIAGIVIGSIAGALLFLGIGWSLASRKSKKSSEPSRNAESTPPLKKAGHDNKGAELKEKEIKSTEKDLEAAGITSF